MTFLRPGSKNSKLIKKVTSSVVQSNCVRKTFCAGIPELISVSLSRAMIHSSALCFTWEQQERFMYLQVFYNRKNSWIDKRVRKMWDRSHNRSEYKLCKGCGLFQTQAVNCLRSIKFRCCTIQPLPFLHSSCMKEESFLHLYFYTVINNVWVYLP